MCVGLTDGILCSGCSATYFKRSTGLHVLFSWLVIMTKNALDIAPSGRVEQYP
jgi:hypothetical protein